ncbi:MAG: Mur ligase family protein [Lactobacillaceae bacterium]|jgi:UDP-N-acetylmuramoyl-L-alanyl-D-glutamate--2,6-diaminopimelate ligase|nr:Mur ligase family protein [Lactobacillaceae bacterium]
MSIRSKIAFLAGSTALKLTKKFKKTGGTSYPGKLAYKIDPNILKDLSKNMETIIVTGTNGKTLTTALSVRVLQETGRTIITNPSGSNMVQGIISTLLEHHKEIKHGSNPLAVLEVDEANVAKIAQLLKPKYFILTNIFRDQLDRYGEIYTTYDKITDGIKLVPNATVLANGDSPIFSRINFPNSIKYFGFNHSNSKSKIKAPNNTDGILSPSDDSVLYYNFITYANLGKFFSITDDFKRPELKYFVTKVSKLKPTFSDFLIDKEKFHIPIGGLYNIYNALAAYSIGKEYGIESSKIGSVLNKDSRIFGRQEVININGKQVTIVLIKNPVGTNSVIDMMSTDDKPFDLITLLNANYADGIDTSWIFDAEFEKLHKTKLKQIIIGGQRYKDLDVRLKFAGFKNTIIEKDFEQLIDLISNSKTKHFYIAATYTAMLDIRKVLNQKGFVKESF